MKVSLVEVLKKLMALHNVEVTEHKSPFIMENVDWGLRKTFYPDFKWQELINTFAAILKQDTLYILQDIFDVYYAVFVTDYAEKAVAVVGPYRHTGVAFNEDNYRSKGFAGEELEQIKEYVLRIPHIHEDVIIRQIAAVLSTATADKNIVIKHIKENADKKDKYKQFSFVRAENSCVMEMDRVEQRYAIENEILEAVSLGNATNARKAMQKLMREDISDRYTISAQQQKKSLIIINTLFRKAVEAANVHPYYIDEISYRFFQKIDLVSSHREQIKLMDEMITAYCEYVKKYSSEQYSSAIRNTLNYIHQNISNKISLREIAQHLKVSPSHLSRQFRAETGKTVVEYINSVRIVIAANKLKQTNLTVAKISESIGIQDTNYFSRLFRKYMGCSPTEYRE